MCHPVALFCSFSGLRFKRLILSIVTNLIDDDEAVFVEPLRHGGEGRKGLSVHRLDRGVEGHIGVGVSTRHDQAPLCVRGRAGKSPRFVHYPGLDPLVGTGEGSGHNKHYAQKDFTTERFFPSVARFG